MVKQLCWGCSQEVYLSAEIKSRGRHACCSYCGSRRRTFCLEEIADRVEQAFAEHYIRTSDQPDEYQSMMLRDHESDYSWDREGEPTVTAIMDAAEVSEQAAEDLQAILDERHSDADLAAMGEETEFSADACYELKGASSDAWNHAWRELERSLRTEARLFNKAAAAHLGRLFEGLDALTGREGRSVVLDAGPGTAWPSLFRARTFQSDSDLEAALGCPDQLLGPPPPGGAAAGRMNAQGISVFYGANTPTAALAEVRPPVGSQVAVARFDIVRELRLLDLTAFERIVTKGSIFDPGYVSALEKAEFLRTLASRLSQPVMPSDEAFAYLATQAVAEYLANSSVPRLDGLIFPAVQASDGSLNVVLFHKASCVEPLARAQGSEVNVTLAEQDEDGWHRDYTVVVRSPPPEPPALRASGDGVSSLGLTSIITSSVPEREVPWDNGLEHTLRIVAAEINVHVVRAVTFKTDVHQVNWVALVKQEIEEF